MGAPYFRFAMFYQTILDDRGLTVPEVARICEKFVSKPRHYRFLRVERLPESDEIKFMEKRLKFDTPPEYLRSEDSHGRPVKNMQLDLTFKKKRKRKKKGNENEAKRKRN